MDSLNLEGFNEELKRLRYVEKDLMKYDMTGSNLMLVMSSFEDTLLEVKKDDTSSFAFPAIVEFVIENESYPYLISIILSKISQNEALFFERACPESKDSRTIIELLVMTDNIKLDDITLTKIVEVAKHMPGTKFYESTACAIISQIPYNFDIYKRDNEGSELLPPNKVCDEFASFISRMFTFGENLKRDRYDDLRFLLLRHRYDRLESLPFPYSNTGYNLVYSLYDGEDEYDNLIDDYFVDISNKIYNEIGIDYEFHEDLLMDFDNIKVKLKAVKNGEIIISDVLFFKKLLSIRPFGYFGGQGDSN